MTSEEKEIEDLKSQFLDSGKFYTAVSEIVEKDDIDYLTAIMLVCDNHEIDPEDLVKNKLISPLLESKLETEQMEAGNLKREPTLKF